MNASPADIVHENFFSNFSTAVNHPLLILVSQLPNLSQQYPPLPKRRGSHHHGFMTSVISMTAFILILLLVALPARNQCYKENEISLILNGSSCIDVAILIETNEQKKSECYEPKIIPDKLLPVSSYIRKQITYEVKVIMKATMDLHDDYRIGGSVHRANINAQILAIKKTKEDVSEELKILRKVNHANLMKLLGTSSNAEGNCFLVYEYVENRSLDKSVTSSRSMVLLTWTRRLKVA
ncbi:hypothetical protein K2173_021277 [Erythroxylum novogranatense]|uniref:Serine-threonine/tyrosine-protein kinase catalytic domain-containing protein n=1 Tax=Erythroxylum novogranatense TaxID=1862640 RepID=A0AAV8TWT2_9ROSI|nr:hypothetical protein K2173_021277 [Erythroxylum novogranatense]